MLPVSSDFSQAERADVNQVASKIYLVLGNYASDSGSSASASSSDGSGNYPASGAIDGDRTELNVGPASTADNDIGLSSWRSATAPSVTPQTLTIDFGQTRTINRIKLYHLSSHGLSSYKLESSPDNSAWTLIAKTTTQGGTIDTTHELDTVDFEDVSCRYVKLTIANTVVVADKANVVELEVYRLVEISSRVLSANLDRARDYKLGDPLASTLQVLCSNSDRYFSFSHAPSISELADGFVNQELRPNIGVIAEYGFAYGGGEPDVAQVFVGYVDSIRINPGGRTALIQCRDGMKTCFNQTVSSKLKTSLDIADCIQYALNLANISNWEMDLDTTSITEDYFFINNQNVITVVRDLVQAAGDALFYFDEDGIAVFQTYLGNTPLSRIESTTADFNAGTLLQNIDNSSVADQFGRKWFLIDSFADGNLNSNPVWNNRGGASSQSDDSYANFNSGSVLTNIDQITVANSIRRNWFLLDSFADADLSHPLWETFAVFPGSSTPVTNTWSASTGALRFSPTSFGIFGSAFITFSAARGGFPAPSASGSGGTFQSMWEFKYQINNSSNAGSIDFFFISSIAYRKTTGFPQVGLAFGYCINIDRATGLVKLKKVDDVDTNMTQASTTIQQGSLGAANNSSQHTIRVLLSAGGVHIVYLDGVLLFQGTGIDKTIYMPSQQYLGVQAYSPGSSCVFSFDDFYYTNLAATPTEPGSTVSNSQAVFESRTFDQGATVVSEGSLTSDITLPVLDPGWPGQGDPATISFYTATSADGISWDAYVAVPVSGLIQSTPRRYIKYKAVFNCPADFGLTGNYPNVRTATLNSVTISYFTRAWECISNAVKYAPLATLLPAGLDLSFTPSVGTWRVNVTMVNGSSAGGKFRLYAITTGYDIPSTTYINGYYAEVDQGAGTISIYKINGSATRTLLATVAQAINTAAHSLRITRTAAGVLSVYWDEVFKVTATDTSFTSSQALAFEYDPHTDTNGYALVDDVVYSPAVDGTGAISSSQAIFESDVIDMGASVSALGLFQSNYVTPAATSLAFYTATSSDGITFDAYVSVAPGAAIASAVKRYLKYKVVLTCPVDSGIYGNATTPIVTDVTINWTIGAGSAKYPASVSYVFADDGMLLGLEQEISDLVGGDTAILNDISVQAQPLILSGTALDTQWQGTTGTPALPIAAGNPLNVTNGQTLTYKIVLPNGMDTSFMSGASPAAGVVTFAGGGAGSWSFTRIHPTQPILKIVITGSGTITDLRVIGKSFTNSNTIATQTAVDAASVKQYGDRPLPLSNPYIINSSIALSIATRLLQNYKDALSFVPSCVVRPSFAAQIGDRITITETNADLSADFIIVGLAHSYALNVESGDVKTTLTLLKVLS